MANVIRIGNAQGFWGDSQEAARKLATQQPNLDYLTLDYLAEVSMSILAIQREKDPSKGYARDFLDVIESLIPQWKTGSSLKVISNAGGLNPHGCAEACQRLLQEAGCGHLKIGIVSGDDVLAQLQQEPAAMLFRNLDSEEPLTKIASRLVTANAYFGALPIAEALQKGAHIVITGRVADPSLTVGPCIAHFNWKQNDYNAIAGATVAGHLIECGTQVTGGISTNWLDLIETEEIGFPIAEISSDGSCVLTKPPHTGGAVTLETVKEQLLYELGDPAHYLSPDATVSFLGLILTEEGENRIAIKGAQGSAPPQNYKVSATYCDGFKIEGMLTIFGVDAVVKARRCGEILLQKLARAGQIVSRSHVECLGGNAVAGGILPSHHLQECVLRIALAADQVAPLEYFSKELASLVTSGPQGVTGYTSGRPHVRQVFGFWPCLIERSKVLPTVTIKEAR
jgi:hypothetical protein